MRRWSLAVAFLALAVGLGGCLGSGGGLFGGVGPRDYLSSRDYDTWIIEVDSVQGQAPSAGALDLLRSRLMEVADKPGGIEVRHSETLAGRGGTWSARDIQDLDASSRDLRTGGNTVVTHLMFLDGQYATDNVIGVAIGHTTIAIFMQTIRDGCGPICLGGIDAVVRAVLVHEFGHALGLVDNGIPMVSEHEDEAHPGHSSNDQSVMWWQVETIGIFGLGPAPPSTFDAADKADMCNAGGKC